MEEYTTNDLASALYSGSRVQIGDYFYIQRTEEPNGYQFHMLDKVNAELSDDYKFNTKQIYRVCKEIMKVSKILYREANDLPDELIPNNLVFMTYNKTIFNILKGLNFESESLTDLDRKVHIILFTFPGLRDPKDDFKNFLFKINSQLGTRLDRIKTRARK